MAVFFTVGAVAGILLGLRFKVLVLVPAISIATVSIVLSGHGLRVIIPTVVGTVALLQFGYIGGCFLRAMARAYLSSQATLRHRAARSKPAH